MNADFHTTLAAGTVQPFPDGTPGPSAYYNQDPNQTQIQRDRRLPRRHCQCGLDQRCPADAGNGAAVYKWWVHQG